MRQVKVIVRNPLVTEQRETADLCPGPSLIRLRKIPS